MSIKQIQKISEQRNKRLIGNDAYLIQLINELSSIRHNDYAISIVAQTLMLGITPEGGDGD